MANDARIVLQQRLSQQLVMTPQLRMAIKILQVSRAELETLVDQELTENPLLEEQVEEKAVDAVPTVDSQTGTEDWQANGDTPPEVQEASSVGEIDWKEFAENYGNDMHGTSGGNAPSDDDDRRPALENILVKRTLLPDHLMWQPPPPGPPETEKEGRALLIRRPDKDGPPTTPPHEAAVLPHAPPP